MKYRSVVAVLAAIACASVSANGPRSSNAPLIIHAAPNQQNALTNAQRARIAQTLVMRFASEVQSKGSNLDVWAREVGRMVGSGDAAHVQKAALMPTLQATMAMLNVRSVGSSALLATPTALGDSNTDTVYTPLPNGRCRVADSRVINNPLPGGASRPIDTEGVVSYASQGGNGSSAGDGSANCGIPEGTAALAVSVTVLSNGQEGVFKFYPDGVSYTEGNTVYYTSTVSAANDIVVRSCQSCAQEQRIFSSSSVHYVIDIMGYFMRPEAAALECIETSPDEDGARKMLPANGGTGSVYSPECNRNIAKFEQTATNCKTDSPDAYLVFMADRVCSAKNTGATDAILQVTTTCCRTPGAWNPNPIAP